MGLPGPFTRGLVHTLLLWLLLVTMGSQEDAGEPCTFPQTLRTTEWPWKILSPDPNDRIFHRYRRVTFREHDMRIDYMRRRYTEDVATAYTYTCVKSLPNDKYLVTREDESTQNKYTCIQFIYRGTNTYQLKFGPLEERRSDTLCNNDRLEMVDAPMVYYHTVGGYWDERRNVNSTYKLCPLHGGYLVKWFDEDKRPGCNHTLDPLKFENECTHMEGIRFHSYSGSCPLPDARLERPHYCFASWVEGAHTFLLLWQRNDDFDMPCMRVGTSGVNKLTAYLFLDGVCDRSPTITNSTLYRKLELEKLVVPDMCSNENSQCTDRKAMPACTAETASICRRYCKVCQKPLPWVNETFPQSLQGRWQQLDFNSKISNTIEFDGGVVRYPSRGGEYRLTSRAQCRRGGALSRQATEYTLLSTYDNGCSPRVTSAIVVARSKSVVSIHFSATMPAKVNTELDVYNNHWRFTDDYRWWCADISLEAESNPRNSMYRYWYDMWVNLLRVENVREPIPCDFYIPSKLQRFSLKTSRGDICHGAIHEANGDRFQVDFYATCSKGDSAIYKQDVTMDTTVSVLATFEFFCLASFKDSRKNQFVITQTSGAMLEVNITLLCWFISDSGHIVYWLPIGKCDTSTELQIMNRRVQPLATLYFESGCACFHSSYLFFLAFFLVWTSCITKNDT